MTRSKITDVFLDKHKYLISAIRVAIDKYGFDRASTYSIISFIQHLEFDAAINSEFYKQNPIQPERLNEKSAKKRMRKSEHSHNKKKRVSGT
jgi:hypothetical protein